MSKELRQKKRTSLPRFVNCFSKRIIERTSAWIQFEVTDYTFIYNIYCIILYHIIVCMIAFVDYFNISNMQYVFTQKFPETKNMPISPRQPFVVSRRYIKGSAKMILQDTKKVHMGVSKNMGKPPQIINFNIF